MTANEVVTSFNEIVNKAAKGRQTAEQVAKSLTQHAAELRKQADALVLLARKLVGNADVSLRQTIVLKEGERHPKAPKPGRKPKVKSKAYHKPTQAEIDAMTPERKAQYLANVERCKKMREAKKKNSLVEKFAQTKIS